MIIKKDLQIAIDGPVSSGTSTLSLALARKLNFLFIYTGAMYRAAAYLYITAKNKGSILSEPELVQLVKSRKITLKKPSKPRRYCDVYLDGKDITSHLFSPEVNRVVPEISKISKLRKHFVSLQRQLAKNKAVIMEGRDITTVVLPNADLKIFLTADLNTRVKRRWIQAKQSGQKISLDDIKAQIIKRDTLDTTRKNSPLTKAEDAWLIDSTNLVIDQTVQLVIDKLIKLKLINKT